MPSLHSHRTTPTNQPTNQAISPEQATLRHPSANAKDADKEKTTQHQAQQAQQRHLNGARTSFEKRGCERWACWPDGSQRPCYQTPASWGPREARAALPGVVVRTSATACFEGWGVAHAAVAGAVVRHAPAPHSPHRHRHAPQQCCWGCDPRHLRQTAPAPAPVSRRVLPQQSQLPQLWRPRMTQHPTQARGTSAGG